MFFAPYFSRPCHRHVLPVLWEAVVLQESDQGESDTNWAHAYQMSPL